MLWSGYAYCQIGVLRSFRVNVQRGGEMPVNTLHASFFRRFNQLLLIQPATNARWSLNRRDNNSSNDTRSIFWCRLKNCCPCDWVIISHWLWVVSTRTELTFLKTINIFFISLGWHVLTDFSQRVFRKHVLRNASLPTTSDYRCDLHSNKARDCMVRCMLSFVLRYG